jgi:predicted nucleic acid-binding protein
VIVFDAGVLIAHLEVGDVFHDAAVGFLDENEEMEFAVSPITLAECLVRPAGNGGAHRLFQALQRLHFEERDVTPGDAIGLAEVRATTGLKMSDALVLYTAESRGAELVTTDRALARAAEERGVTATLLEA